MPAMKSSWGRWRSSTFPSCCTTAPTTYCWTPSRSASAARSSRRETCAMICHPIEPELDGSGDVAGVRGLEIAPDMTREPLNATKERANLGPHTLTVGDDLIGQVPLQVGVDQLVRVQMG